VSLVLFAGATAIVAFGDDATEHEIETLKEQRKKLDEKIKTLSDALPKKEIQDYALKDSDGKVVNLSSLFSDKDYVIIILNMGASCGICTVYGDQFNGGLKHLNSVASFYVVSGDEPKDMKEFAAKQGWKFTMLSRKGLPFGKDLGVENEKGDGMPGILVLEKKDKKILIYKQLNFFKGDRIAGLLDVLWMIPSKKEASK
jgi:predicted dithiol-disulfide oxidoreductase (DUF899 family)